ncbi:alanine dehydrogenase [Cohnella sp. GCM10020058]|uniref:alanine dehydrogenase n=1 Tax=Cohnella sp. GCM10020058 TaxID=3317330 RepID=UPI0036369CDD
MRISVPKETKNNENRVALTPAGVVSFVKAGHRVMIETGAGAGSGFPDEQYVSAGAEIGRTADEVWSQADMVMKVKEPLPAEYDYFREDLVLFTYLHLAAEPGLAKALIDRKVTAVAYETVEEGRSLPLLTPMSEVAGRMSVQIGAQLLEKPRGGKGILLGAVPGVKRGIVAIIGGGVVGTQAAKVAVGFGAEVSVIDSSAERLRQLDDLFGDRVQTLMSNSLAIAEAVAAADLVIGAVLIPGAKAPKLVTTEMVKSMQPGSVIIDVAIDQGGVVETADRITTHDKPTYERHGIVHYAVANMPGAVPRTSTLALTNATFPYALLMADRGLQQAIEQRPGLATGVNMFRGAVTHQAVALALGYEFSPLDSLLNGASCA